MTDLQATRGSRYEYIWKKMAEICAAGDAPNSSPSKNEEKARNSTSETRKPPLISLAMLGRAMGNEIASLDENEVSRRVFAGVLLRDDKKLGEAKNGEEQEQPYTHKYWVDKDLNKSCWMVLAKALAIIWSDDSKRWQWPEEEEPCYWGNEKLPVAELLDVCWLEIKGNCKTIMLSPRTMYEVAIVVNMSNEADGWEIPVNLSLELPDGNKQEPMKRLDRLEKEKWTRIVIGKFETTPNTVGEIRFSLMQTDGHWKSGLRVKGVDFRPVRE